MMMKKIVAAVCLIVFGMQSCEKAEISKNESEMRFSASYDLEPLTKAPIPFPSGNKSTIIGYTAGANLTSATPVAGTPLEATGAGTGVLTPDSPLYLPKGSYDFYSLSINSTTQAGVTFKSGVSGQLVNQRDYIWAKHTSVAQGGSVTFAYTHKAVGIEVNITAGTGVSAMSVTSIRFTPTKADASSKMTLSSGVIGSAADKDVLTAMNLTAAKGSYIMLPMASQSLDIEVTVNATIGGVSQTAKVYTGVVPARAYAAGTYYTINLTISATALTFTGSTVDDWATQTITGVTLTE